jgi:hypothetical protein
MNYPVVYHISRLKYLPCSLSCEIFSCAASGTVLLLTRRMQLISPRISLVLSNIYNDISKITVNELRSPLRLVEHILIELFVNEGSLLEALLKHIFM